jgi:hypothetical protein
LDFEAVLDLGTEKRKTKVREFEEIERGEGGCGVYYFS